LPNIVRRIGCRGRGSDLFLLSVGNLLRTILTLGLYEPWARTRVRRYLWSAVEFGGEPFVYHGTGKELFIGRIKGTLLIWGVFFLAGAIAAGAGFALGPAAVESGVLELILWPLLAAGFAVLLSVAIIGARRYRMSRTSWRGIRFSFRGSWRQYLPILLSRVLVPLTLGLAYPFVYIRETRFTITGTRFGNTPFAFDGSGRDLFGPWLKALVLTPLTLGLYWFWFAAERHRYVWGHTWFGGARFMSTVDGRGLLGLWLGNLLLLIITLGVAWPYVTIRRLEFLTGHLVVVGAPDLDAVVQDAQEASAAGEGVAAALDFETDLGLAM
jgi:uncharacterized membrane protein YjgN (DUF898 family)